MGAVETWAPDNLRVATEIAASAPRTRTASRGNSCGTAKLDTWLIMSDHSLLVPGALLGGVNLPRGAAFRHSTLPYPTGFPTHDTFLYLLISEDISLLRASGISPYRAQLKWSVPGPALKRVILLVFAQR